MFCGGLNSNRVYAEKGNKMKILLIAVIAGAFLGGPAALASKPTATVIKPASGSVLQAQGQDLQGSSVQLQGGDVTLQGSNVAWLFQSTPTNLQ